MTWYFLDTGFNTGSYNMEFDLHLANICKPGEAYLRLYRWKPYCISLGANQDAASVNADKAKADGVDVVVRPTGGRAILHAEELTYSVVIALDEKSSARNIYNEINAAILKGLALYDPKLADAELENIQADFQNFYKEDLSAVCFAASARSEIKFTGKKLVGSAQRKMNSSVLQHGSILCGDYHTHIIDYLNVSDLSGQRIADQMLKKTTDIKSILNNDVDYHQLSKCLAAGFEKYYNVKFCSPSPHAMLINSKVTSY